MSDSTPVKRADSQIRAARLNRLASIFVQAQSQQRCESNRNVIFIQRKKSTVCVCTCLKFCLQSSGWFLGFGVSVYLQYLSQPCGLHKRTKIKEWPSGGLARTDGSLSQCWGCLLTRQWTEQRSSASQGWWKRFCVRKTVFLGWFCFIKFVHFLKYFSVRLLTCIPCRIKCSLSLSVSLSLSTR